MLDIKDRILSGYSFIDLFAGIGGFRLALESLGAECVYSSEWDKEAQNVYKRNFGIIPDGDITKVDENKIPNHDILCAGFPCQSFSISGKRMGFEDSRGTLFFDVARIVRCKRPKVVFMENVKNLVNHDNGMTFSVIRNTMEGLGYRFFYNVLNAADYGIPQKRERVYMVCVRDDLYGGEFSFPHSVPLMKHVEDYLLDDDEIPNDLYVNRDDIFLSSCDTCHYSSSPIRLGIVNKGCQGERIYSIKGSAITLSANGGGVFARTGGYLVNGRFRKLHQRECARLMGYPDTFIYSDKTTHAYKQFGNSVVIDVIQYIGLEIGKYLRDVKQSQK